MKTNPTMRPDAPAIISLRDIGRSFSSEDGVLTEVLKHVSLDVRQGEIVALVGPSGCGKTTLLNIVSWIDVPTSGQAFVAWSEISAMDEDARADWRSRQLAFVFQDFHLLPHLGVEENVSLLADMFSLDRRMSVSEAIEKVGLSHRVSTPIVRLSRGERQRVAIARAFLADTPIILADEPTGNLDAANAAIVMDMIVSFARELGVSVLLITHDPVVAERADRIFDMSRGEIVDVTPSHGQ